MLDKFVNSKIGQKILGKPSDANKLSPSTAGHSFGKGQVTPGGPLGQIARSNMNKNEGAHSQDAMALNPDFDKIGKKPGVMGKIGSGLKKVADVIAPGDDELLDRLEKSSGAAPRQPGAKEPRYMEAMSPAKQKSFAALAPPKDKITFADKIAGAKKEVDEMLGDVAAEAMKKALGGGKGRNAEMDEASQDNAFTAHKRARVEQPKVGTITHGSKHDVEEIPGGRRVTRRTDAQGISVGADDDKPADGEKRGRGRPKGAEKAPERVTGGATKHKGGRKTNEGEVSTGNLQQMWKLVTGLKTFVQDPDGQALLKELTGMVKHYMNQGDEQKIDEKAVSKKQQKFMGMVHAAQKGEMPASGAVAKTAKTMGKKDAEDFAATKHKGLPEKKKSEGKKKEVDETSDSTPSKSSGGFKFGGGIYDSINRDLENMISESMSRLDESMSINMSMNNDEHGGPTRSLTVTATDDDAMKLSQLLKSAGLGGGDEGYGGSGYKSACGCGTPDCSCGEQQMDEVSMNQPDYPTNTETSSDALQYSGGLNKPKSTGQTTIPVIASQDDRQESYAAEEEDAIKRMMEMAGIEFTDEMLEEGFREKLAAAGLAGAMALGSLGAGAAQAAPQQGLGTPTAATQQQKQDILNSPLYKSALSLSYASKDPIFKSDFERLQQFYKEQSDRISRDGKLSKNMEPIAAQDQKKLDLKFKDGLEKLMQRYGGVNEEQVMAEEDALSRMMEMAGVKKKEVDEEKTDEGNLLTKGLADDNIEIGDKIPGTNVIKKKDIDESIFAMTANLWKSYKG